MENTGKSTGDIFGLAPYGESLKIVTKGGVDEISKFLEITCRPLLEELGLWARDRFKIWRYKNLYNTLSKAEGKVDYQDGEIRMVSPRLAFTIAENASLEEEGDIQEMWAGLFVSAMSSDGKDDSNLIFTNLLKQLTAIQARMLKYAFDNSLKVLYDSGLITGCKFCITLDEAYTLFHVSDFNRIDRELDSLRSLGLIDGGLDMKDKSLTVNLTLTSLGIYLLARCLGDLSIGTSNFITEQEYRKHPEYRTPTMIEF